MMEKIREFWRYMTSRPKVFYDDLSLPSDAQDVKTGLRAEASRHRSVTRSLLDTASVVVAENERLRKARDNRGLWPRWR